MEEEQYIVYCEWANDELLVERGQGNWCRNWSKIDKSNTIETPDISHLHEDWWMYDDIPF